VHYSYTICIYLFSPSFVQSPSNLPNLKKFPGFLLKCDTEDLSFQKSRQCRNVPYCTVVIEWTIVLEKVITVPTVQYHINSSQAASGSYSELEEFNVSSLTFSPVLTQTKPQKQMPQQKELYGNRNHEWVRPLDVTD
jgi:hypothetical protein